MVGEWWRGERGSAPAEFVMVAGLLTVLALGILQLSLALFVRNTVLDAAAEGARIAALADGSLGDGAQRTRQLIGDAMGRNFTVEVSADYERRLGVPATVITVRARLPVVGLLGVEGGLEVSGHAALETVGDAARG